MPARWPRTSIWPLMRSKTSVQRRLAKAKKHRITPRAEEAMLHQEIEKLKDRVSIKQRYDNFIGGAWVAPVGGEYFDNFTPITGHPICQVARGRAADIELALAAAHKARDAWGKTSATERANILNKIADRMEANLTPLALVESIDHGKPIRETTGDELP